MGRKKKQGEWTLYIHKNKQNGKVYVGITSRNPKERWGYNGNGYKPDNENVKPTHFWLAIQKYGWENFEHIIILTGLFKDEAELLEQQYIQLFDSYENGYNSNFGGKVGSKGYRHTDEAKQRMTEKRRGVKHTKEWSKRISESQLCKRPVICLETGIIYDNPTVCAEKLNLPKQRILETCRGKTYTAYGFHFQYADEDYKSIEEIESKRKDDPRKRAVMCIETNEIYASGCECCKSNKLSRLAFNRAIKEHFALKGFHYKYLDDDITLEQIQREHDERCSNKVKCIEMNRIFPNITECANYFGSNNSKIYSVCKKHGIIQGYHLEFIDYKPRVRKVYCENTKEVFNNIKECAKRFDINERQLSFAIRENREINNMKFIFYDEINEESA